MCVVIVVVVEVAIAVVMNRVRGIQNSIDVEVLALYAGVETPFDSS